MNDSALVKAMVADINLVTEKLDNWGMQAAGNQRAGFRRSCSSALIPRTIHNFDTFGPVILNCYGSGFAMESQP